MNAPVPLSADEPADPVVLPPPSAAEVSGDPADGEGGSGTSAQAGDFEPL